MGRASTCDIRLGSSRASHQVVRVRTLWSRERRLDCQDGLLGASPSHAFHLLKLTPSPRILSLRMIGRVLALGGVRVPWPTSAQLACRTLTVQMDGYNLNFDSTTP